MKKIEVEPLPSFIIQRLTPVVYCNISTELVRAEPRCFSKIRRAWKKITKQNNLNIRIYFPAISFNSKSINNYLNSAKLIFNSREKGFYFDVKDNNTLPNRELQTTQYLRQVMYETDFLQTGNFFDLPISVMFFSLGTEQPVTRKFPAWAQYTIDQASGIHAIYEEAKLEEILQAFIIRSLKSRLDRLLDNTRADYLNKKDFINFRRVIDAEACRGNHKAAYVQVNELLKSPNIPVEIQTSSIFLKIELEIILGEINNDTINDILQCIEYSPTYEWRLLAILVHFWISFKMSKPTTTEIERYITSESPINPIVRPFLLEQISIFKGKSLPLTLMQASDLHKATGNEEHCLRCYWRAYNSISSTNLYYAKNYLLHSIVSTLFHEKPESATLMSPFLGDLLKESRIQKAPITATYLALTEPTEVFECNFIKVSLIDVSFDSPITGPSNYEEDWYQTAIRLFGFKNREKFLNKKETNELSVGDVLSFNVEIISLCKEFEAGIASLSIKGNASSSKENVSFHKKVTLDMTIEDFGEIVVYGIEFLWAEKIRIFAKFTKPFFVTVPNDCPRAKLNVDWPIFESIAGHPTKFVLSLKAITDLTHLHVLCPDNVFLMEPKTKEVSGFYKLNDMKCGDEKELEFSFSSSNPGSYKLFVFIGYSNENRELIGMKKYFSNVEVFQESSSDIPLYPCFRSEVLEKMKEPNFKLSLSLENNNLEISVSPKSESLKDLKLEVAGMVVGKNIIRIEHIKRGNSFSHKVVILSYKNLIVRVHTKLTSYATNISKYLEYLST